MDMIKKAQELRRDLQDKEVRDSFVLDHINIGIPLQIRALREQKGREWTQKELASRAGMKQERISAMENPNYKNAFTLSTLTRLASAFDVGIIVRFVPISDLVKWELAISPEKLEAVSFDKDTYFTTIPLETTYAAPSIHPSARLTATRDLSTIATAYAYTPSVGSVMVNFLNPSPPIESKIRNLSEFKAARERKEANKEIETQKRKAIMGDL